MLALCTGCDFNTAPDKVITLRNAVFIAHMIECALFCGVIGYEEELVIVMLLHPIKAEFLCLGGQIAAFAFRGNIAVFLFKSIVKLRKSDNGERKRGHNEFNAESFLYAFAVFSLTTPRAYVNISASICITSR